MKLKRSRAHLDPGPSSLVLLPMNRKSTVEQYRGGVQGPDHGRKKF